MQIVFVVDTVQPSNGVATSAQRAAVMLRERGHRVKVVATDGDLKNPSSGWISAAAPDPADQFIARPWRIPVVEWFSRPQHFTFATPDRDLLRRAFEGADVVHIWLATPFGHAALELAHEMGIPVSAGFHVQPENISYNLWLGRRPATIDFIYRVMREKFYDQVEHIHCPSKFIATQLEEHGYRATLHVISNGVTLAFRPPEHKNEWTLGCGRPFRIMSVGRLSPEKRHTLLIDAVAKSTYRDQIELEVAGRGPDRMRLKAHALRLKNPLRLSYFSQPDLLAKLQDADLYVHPADAEIEAVACLEAIACGLVPVIADSPRSAASQFALDERSLFPTNKRVALTRAIDWWIEHPEERAAMSPRYAEHAQHFTIARSAELFEQMLNDAVEDGR